MRVRAGGRERERIRMNENVDTSPRLLSHRSLSRGAYITRHLGSKSDFYWSKS